MMDYGTGQHRRIISVNQSFESLGHTFSNALLFFHAFTGCESTSSFYGKPKTFWFKQLQSYPRRYDVTLTFKKLSWTPKKEDVDTSLAEIEKFVCYCYGRGDLQTVDMARYQIFTSKASGNLQELPPTKNSSKLHIMRSAFQGGWIWGNTIRQTICPPVSEWGWFYASDSMPSAHLCDNCRNL